MNQKVRNRYHRCLLLDEISNKHKRLKSLNKQLAGETDTLKSIVTWMKSIYISYSINLVLNKYVEKVQRTHKKKLDNLFEKKQQEDGLETNPNNIIWNFTSRTLSNEKYDVLRYGLNHGLATHQNTSDIIATAESVWDQISRQSLCKETDSHMKRAKNSLGALAFNLIDLDNNQIFKDKKKINIIKNLRKDFILLKPDKGNGIVLIKTTDYYSSLEKLFSDKSKFKQISEDPTPTRLSTLQRYLKQLNKRGELDDNTFKKIRPQSARIARGHGLPKMHKHFDNIPSFRPIVDTTGTTHYSVDKYLSQLLNPLTQNEYSRRDSFDAANRIDGILPLVQENEEYMFVSLDVVSLFTNVPLRKTVNTILKRVYNEKLINTSLSKGSLKKLILGTC